MAAAAWTVGATVRVLDAFCGGGGAGWGLRAAGFEVVGVDVKRRQCGYPAGELIIADAIEVLRDRAFMADFDAVWASPPCQTHSRTKHLRDAQGKTTSKVDLIPETRDAVGVLGIPYVIENVPGAPLRPDLMLCGSMFGLQVNGRQLRRHRVFESNVLLSPPGPCHHVGKPLGVYGSKGDRIPSGGHTCNTVEEARELMGMPWASWAALVEAIPPAYSEWIGRRLPR